MMVPLKWSEYLYLAHTMVIGVGKNPVFAPFVADISFDNRSEASAAQKVLVRRHIAHIPLRRVPVSEIHLRTFMSVFS